MKFGRLVSAVALWGVFVGLPMCGSEDSKKRVTAEGGEAGAEPSVAGTPSSGGAQNPMPQGGAAGAPDEVPAGSGGMVALPLGGESNGGAPPGAAGETGAAGAAGALDPGMGGAPAFCAVDNTSCCDVGEPSCDTWPGMCGQDMNSYSCCDAGVRQTCSVEYFDANYHVVFGKEDCLCSEGFCACSCVKGDSCPYQEADCISTSWHDACVQGNSPTCCDSSTGIREKCVFVPGVGKTFTNSVVIDECTGTGFGDGSCLNCLDAQDPPCDDAFETACNDSVSYCSDSVVGYRLSCMNGATHVECTCDPSL